MVQVQRPRTAAEVRAQIEGVFLQLDVQGESVAEGARSSLREKQQSYSGPDYLAQLEKNAVYLRERAQLTNGASAHYLSSGQPIVQSEQEAWAYATTVGIPSAREAATLHLSYIRTGDCSGCEVCHKHSDYVGMRDLRQEGEWDQYLHEVEFAYVYSQGLLMTAECLLGTLLMNRQFAAIARGVQPSETAAVIEERVTIRWNLWSGNLHFTGTEPVEEPSKRGGSDGPEQSEELVQRRLQQGLDYDHQGGFEDAIREYQAALAIDVDNALAHNNLGYIYYQEGRLAEAILEYQAALQTSPQLIIARLNLGNAYLDQNRVGEAMEEYRAALRSDPHHPGAHHGLGVCYFRQSQLEEAARELQAALRINPRDVPAHLMLGKARATQGRLEEAIGELRAALRIDPQNLEAHSTLGWAHLEQERWDEAIRDYQTALGIDPNVAENHLNLGWAYWNQGRLEEAIREFEVTLRIDANCATAHLNLGMAYGERGWRDDAIREFQSALRINPNDAAAHYNLGLAYGKGGRFDESRRELRAAAELGSSEAQEFLARLGG